jgi:hypothetical protein
MADRILSDSLYQQVVEALDRAYPDCDNPDQVLAVLADLRALPVAGGEPTDEFNWLALLHDRVCEGSVIMKVQTDRTGDPEGFRIGIHALGEQDHEEYVGDDFLRVLQEALTGDAISRVENTLELWGELDQPPSEEVEAIVACLGDDAASLRDETHSDDERAANMDEAADLLVRLERANRQLHEMGCKMYAALSLGEPKETHPDTKRLERQAVVDLLDEYIPPNDKPWDAVNEIRAMMKERLDALKS